MVEAVASPRLWNQLPSSLRQPHFSPSVSVLPVHAPTTLTIHNSLCLSLPAQDLPLPQIFPTIDSLPASEMTPRTSRLDRFFWASSLYVFSFFIILFCLVPCGRLSWLLVSFWAHVNIVHHIISYHIISYHIISYHIISYHIISLLDEYPLIVDEIDKKLPSLTSQLQQLHLGNSTDGKLL